MVCDSTVVSSVIGIGPTAESVLNSQYAFLQGQFAPYISNVPYDHFPIKTIETESIDSHLTLCAHWPLPLQ